MRSSLFLVLAVCLISCNNNDPEPTNLISGKKWEALYIEKVSTSDAHYYPGYNIVNDSTGIFYIYLAIITNEGDTNSAVKYDPRFFTYTQQDQENYTFNFKGVAGLSDPYTSQAQVIQGQLLIDDTVLDEVDKFIWE
jgi:hypothetical protein